MGLNTKYMGFNLRSPIIVASSGLTDNVEKVVKSYECGAGAVVLKSLFEEQIVLNSGAYHYHQQDDYSRSLDFSKQLSDDKIIDSYFNLIQESKNEVNIPVIASINCISDDVWYYFVSKIEEAGADGIELNISISPFAVYKSLDTMLDNYIHIIEKVISNISLPVSVKISPFLPNLLMLIKRIEEAGADSVVMFNRHFAPDIDTDKIEIQAYSSLSSSSEIANPLRWISLMSPHTKLSIAGATGIHDYLTIVKFIMAGASAVQICSAVYLKGYEIIQSLNDEISRWMNEKNYSSINDFKGLITKKVDYNADFERIQYITRNYS